MKRPKIIINCAMSADGKIASPSRKQIRISCDDDILRMYNLRNKYDAVLVGIETILSDDPKLTVKEKYVKNPNQPIRIILDSECRTPIDALAVNDWAKTIIFTLKKCNKKFKDNVEVVNCKANKNGFIELREILEILFNHKIKTLMVEGGGTVIWSFLNQGLVDDLFVYMAPIIIGGANTPTIVDGEGIKGLDDVISLKIVDIKKLGPGVLFHYRLIK
jgi:2,5-diamino-6-(ribosylamino)-4(3H)-pyrimidinone 5'-phosphate reductase